MKLIIFGATGSLGRHLVDRALDQGHDVTAFSRDPSALAREHPRLAHFAGDALDPDAVHEAVAGHERAVREAGIAVLNSLLTFGSACTLCSRPSELSTRIFWPFITPRTCGTYLQPCWSRTAASEGAL